MHQHPSNIEALLWVQEEARADEEVQKKAARAEEESRKKAQREAVLKAKREKEAQVAAAEAAKRRQQEAKRDADRKLAMQVCTLCVKKQLCNAANPQMLIAYPLWCSCFSGMFVCT